MEDKQKFDYGTLFLTFLIGVSLSATWSGFFTKYVAFDIFPIICVALSIFCFQQRFQEQRLSVDLAILSLVSVFVGWLGYDVYLRAVHPHLGSNLYLAFICLGIIAWIAYKISKLNKQ